MKQNGVTPTETEKIATTSPRVKETLIKAGNLLSAFKVAAMGLE